MKKWLMLLALSLVIAGCNGGKEEGKQQTQGKQEQKQGAQAKQGGSKNQGKGGGSNGGGKGGNNGAQTAAKGNQPAKMAIRNMDRNKGDVVLFLNHAEHLTEELYLAAATMPNGQTVEEDGVVYRQLPERFDSKEKIVKHFSQAWSRPLAVSLYDNLNTKLVRGKVYLAQPAADFPVLISTRNTDVRVNGGEISVVVREITSPTIAADRTVRYRLVRDEKSKRFEIVSRDGAYGRELFE